MKKILNLKDVQVLNKKDQQEINGSFGVLRPYCNGPKRCCITTPNGAVFCDYGYCQSNGSCVWA
ncbi:hypothetical protein [Aquimarina spongiae]|uniref:Uncharacterized protein n=1 Tax=Aquimarina spongiae TaxID=570521 RepID=A0A1M6BKC2_9FLAO|nr:hypothetical protein [Aquimarina spongiae]SHI49164.1 hypothetical protein SAMN04488508_101882 [Aquimarina spongiae]